MNAEEMIHLRAEFRDALESDVVREFRRATLADMSLGPRRRVWATRLALVAIAITLGTTAGFASAQMGNGRERDSLLAAARSEMRLAVLRRDILRVVADDVTLKQQAGVISGLFAQTAAVNLNAAETEVARLAIDTAEITATGRAPRNDLNAPLVKGRDFVKQRLDLAATIAEKQLTLAQVGVVLADIPVTAGADTDVADITRLEARVPFVRARATLAVLAEKLSLRAEFLQHDTPMDQLTRRLDKAQATQDLLVAQQELALARARASLVERKRQVGLVDEADRLRAQLDVAERENAVQRVVARLRSLN